MKRCHIQAMNNLLCQQEIKIVYYTFYLSQSNNSEYVREVSGANRHETGGKTDYSKTT